ncbi:MAG: sigma-54-dependent transcriptional regulator, partial [Nitrospinota bacterium]
MFTVLIVDDEPSTVSLIKTIVEREPYLHVATAADGEEALEKLTSGPIDILISDIRMPGLDGFELLEAIKEDRNHPLAIMVTALNDAGSAIRSLKLGAYDYITKPVSGEELVHTVRKAAESLRLQRENDYLWSRMEGPWGLKDIVGKSPEMQEVFKTIQQAARSEATVLITGETGTGKELVAQAIHDLSARRPKPFVVIDCTALSGELLASELFGYVKGAFTGAYQSKRGLLEVADGGTAFFDEIGDVDLGMQPKLLRVLQRGEIRRVGDTRVVNVDLRVVAATNQPLAELVQNGEFRPDLFYRLNVVPIHLPPLRERPEDIPLLIQHILAKAVSELKTPSKGFTAGAVEAMMAYPWPGNVRELENELARLVALCPKEKIT